jgi:predicted ester cyclase
VNEDAKDLDELVFHPWAGGGRFGPSADDVPAAARPSEARDRTPSLLQRWFAAGDAGAFAAFDELLHPDVVVHVPLGLSTQGREAEKKVWEEALAAIPGIRHEIQDVFVAESTEAARAVVTGTLLSEFGGIAGCGRSFTVDQGLFAHVRDGLIIEAWEILDTVRLMRQLGSLPEK